VQQERQRDSAFRNSLIACLCPFDTQEGAFEQLTPSRKTPPIRPSAGNPLRKRADAPRDRYLVADFTEEEKRRVIDYCLKQKISVSQFLADVAIEDAKKPRTNPEQETITVKLPADKTQKLAILARLKEKSLDELVQELILKAADEQRQPVSRLKTRNLSYYLTQKEHQLVMKHVAKTGASAKNYIATLALKTIEQGDQKKKK
jgi:hypothetical protein